MDRPDRDGPRDQTAPGNGLNSVDILSDQAGGEARAPSPLRMPRENQPSAAPIGTAEMLSDETIKLHLHAESTDRKTHGDGELTIHPGENGYNAIRQHVGEISPGEIKFVSPWLDTSGRITNDTPVKNDVLPQLTGPDTTGGAQKSPDQTGSLPGSLPGNLAGSAPAVDVVVPPSQAFDATINKTFNDMTVETREIIRQSGAKVTPVHHLTDAMPELKGQAPRGWPTGATWDAVDGCYSGGKKEIIVAEERQSIGSGKWVASGRTEEVLRHETGHAIDYTIKTLSEHDDFKQAYTIDVQAMQAKDKSQLEYFLQSGSAGREETAAEGVADREGGATGGKTFHQDFPNTLKVINDTINVIGKVTGMPPLVGSPAVLPLANPNVGPK